MGTRPRPPAQYPPSATNAAGAMPDGVELPEVARREVLAFPAEYLRDLPIPVAARLSGSGLCVGAVVLVSRRLSQTAAPRSGAADVVFDADELCAIAIGARSERLRAADFRAFCLRKRIDPDFRMTEAVALDGARAEPPRPGAHPWSLQRLLHWLELDLTALEYLGTEPVVHAARAA